MHWTEAIEVIRGRVGHDAYTRLCRDDNPNGEQRDAYREHVIAVASEPPDHAPAPNPAPSPDPWGEKIRACPDFNPGCCASPAPFCSRFNIHPGREKCISCLSGEYA
jgi:hypothetical protein